jgi:hypothetical protein
VLLLLVVLLMLLVLLVLFVRTLVQLLLLLTRPQMRLPRECWQHGSCHRCLAPEGASPQPVAAAVCT